MLKQEHKNKTLAKCPTGISGLDEITGGGLPRNRPSLVCGGPGSGKSMLGMVFLINGATHYHEPGLFVAFEETETELAQNISSLGFNVSKLIARHQLTLDHITFDPSAFTETGAFTLDGLFIRLAYNIDKYSIKRVVLDTIEILFSHLKNEALLRLELQRLLRWFKEKKITLIVTAEQGKNLFSRYGLEEYVADCVIILDNRMDQQIATRRLRIAKYRGSAHGSNEYPFIINEDGITLTPITSMRLDYKASSERVSSGIKELDKMLGGKGFFKGSSILLTGPAGTGKSSFVAAFAQQICKSGGKCLYFAFEESAEQIIRNMNSIGMPLAKWIKKGLLRFYAINPNSCGLENHLAHIKNLTDKFKPSAVIIDPISNLKKVGTAHEVEDTLAVLIAYFKNKMITTMMTFLSGGSLSSEAPRKNEPMSSLMDTWIHLQYTNDEGERNRCITILKSRGMSHSNRLREILISDSGITMQDVYIGANKVLTGSALKLQADKLESEKKQREATLISSSHEREMKQKMIESQITALSNQLSEVIIQSQIQSKQDKKNKSLSKKSQHEVARLRPAFLGRKTKKSKDKSYGKSKKAKTKAKK